MKKIIFTLSIICFAFQSIAKCKDCMYYGLPEK